MVEVRYIASFEEAKEIDRFAIEDYGFPSIVLMENAATRMFDVVREELDIRSRSFAVVCGGGNNGGDGLALARKLFEAGSRVKVFMCSDKIRGDALINFNIAKNIGIDIYSIESDIANRIGINTFRELLNKSDVVIDAIFGIGIKGSVREGYRDIIKALNDSNRFVVAIDTPSGLGDMHEFNMQNINSGSVVRADITISVAFYKRAFMYAYAGDFTGEVKVIDIGFPKELYSRILKRVVIDREMAYRTLPKRKGSGHKYKFGHVLVVGGSKGMSGAPLMSAISSLKSGAGLVSVAVPGYKKDYPQLMSIEIEDFDNLALEKIKLYVKQRRVNTIVLGMGMDTHKNLSDFIYGLLSIPDVYFVIDGGAISIVSDIKECSGYKRAIITPHIGEAGAFLKMDKDYVIANKEKAADDIINMGFGGVVLKDAVSLIKISGDNMYYYLYSPSSALAKAGSGDILAGIIASILSQGGGMYSALCGAYIHNLAGRKAGSIYGDYSVSAPDIIDSIYIAFKDIINTY